MLCKRQQRSSSGASVFLATRDSAGRTCGKAAHNRSLESPRSTVVISCLLASWMRFQDESTIKGKKRRREKERERKKRGKSARAFLAVSPRFASRKERKGEKKGK